MFSVYHCQTLWNSIVQLCALFRNTHYTVKCPFVTPISIRFGIHVHFFRILLSSCYRNARDRHPRPSFRNTRARHWQRSNARVRSISPPDHQRCWAENAADRDRRWRLRLSGARFCRPLRACAEKINQRPSSDWGYLRATFKCTYQYFYHDSCFFAIYNICSLLFAKYIRSVFIEIVLKKCK